MLYIIGTGISDEKDISVKGIEAMKKCDEIYMELYTNKWYGNLGNLEKLAGKKINIINREKTESSFIIEKSENKKISLLVVGDPLSATTHMEIIYEARKRNIETKIIHSSSIFTAIGETGIDLYKFGRTTTLVIPEKNFRPKSPYFFIRENKKSGLHSLILLDVKSEKNKYMTIKEGIETLLEIEKEEKSGLFDINTKIIACCAIGSEEQYIKYEKVSYFIEKDIQNIPATIIIPGNLNEKEKEFLEIIS